VRQAPARAGLALERWTHGLSHAATQDTEPGEKPPVPAETVPRVASSDATADDATRHEAAPAPRREPSLGPVRESQGAAPIPDGPIRAPRREGPVSAAALRSGGIIGLLVPAASAALFIAGASLFIYRALQPLPAVPTPDAAAVLAEADRPAAASSVSAALPANLVEALVKRGNESLALGDIAAARLFFQRAADAGSAPAAVALGKTYDPNYATARGSTPDAAKAADWYRKAAAFGDPAAEGLLQKLDKR